MCRRGAGLSSRGSSSTRHLWALRPKYRSGAGPASPSLKALILAGGQGLRLRPLTDDKPKPLVAVGGKPIAEWQLDWLIKNVELKQATFLCGYKWTRLKEYFGSDYKGVRIDYSVEDSPLGTG